MSKKQQSGSKKYEIQIQYVNIDSIRVPENRRKLNEEIEKELQASIGDVGLLSPINVTQKNGTIILSAGAHRLEACRRLGWERIPAIVLNLDSLNLEAAELDENLVRAELTAFERSITLARRKEIYELLHPESKKGGTSRSKPNDLVSAPPFTKVHSERTGETKSEVEYQVKVGKALGPFAEKIRGSTLENKFVDLLKLSRVKDDRQREAAIDSILTKKAGSVSEIENVIPAAWENLPWQEILAADIKIYNDDFKSVNRGRTVIPPKFG
jgi:ParB family transcriptional regulator, chromosome partitioning protein